MQDTGPTTLITPPPIELNTASALGISPMLIVVMVALLIGMYVVYVHTRTRRIDPRELAFRTITHKLGYSRKQIGQLRKLAVSMGLGSPIGIVINEELAAQALSNKS